MTLVLSLNDKQGAEPGPGAAEAGQSNYHQVQDNLYRITDHNTRSAGDRILRFNYKISVSAQVAMEDLTDLIYRVFFFILTQEWASCETILGLLRPQMASMGFQDWAQITFR